MSVLILCYNERDTIAELIRRVRASKLPNLELILVDDGSTDGTSEMLRGDLGEQIDCLLRHPFNRGKGAAIRSGLLAVSGDIVIFQDADLEYDPTDYARLLGPIARGEADAVYGSRFLAGGGRGKWLNVRFNRAASALIGYLSGRSITDYATGYKAFRTTLLRDLDIRADGFAVDAEVTFKLISRAEVRFKEVAIHYRPRSRSEGKKIRWWHAVEAVATIVAEWISAKLRRAIA